jgi:hypothetical protein
MEIFHIAIHEAGHAVIGTLLNRNIKYVYLTLDSVDTQGICAFPAIRWSKQYWCDPSYSPRFKNIAKREIMIRFAGHIALEIETNGSCGNWNECGGDADVEEIANLGLTMCCGDTIEFENYCCDLWDKTRNMLITPLTWSMIQAVATELTEKSRLNGKRVQEICQSIKDLSD